eukprot:gene19847-25796_t
MILNDNEKISTTKLPATVVENVRIQENFLSKPLKRHPKLTQGRLDNGFAYVILPNPVPEGRFEAHLEILSGSAHELETQQGMAHLLEHVAYMGSPKRQLISGTGSRTNAYTDFHHTVFYASCPSMLPGQFWKKPMLPMALDALLDVMITNVDEDRLEKERSAVLSEASMINKMEYRVECQILSALHAENRISSRFPIGKENLIKAWTREDVQLYHSLHYRPDNVILYVVGDIDVDYTIESIKQKFGGLSSRIDHERIFSESNEFPQTSMRLVNRHFPPVVHSWSTTKDSVSSTIPNGLADSVSVEKPLSDLALDILPKPRIFTHELMQSFSFHLFAKRPMEPLTTERSLRRELMRRMALSALQIRFNVMQRKDPLFTYVDFNQLNWPREGCAVCSMDMTTDTSCWQDAVKLAVREIRRLGLYGLTASELERYKQAVLSEAEQAAAQVDQMNSEAVLGELMEADACGHVYMHPIDRLEATYEAIDSIGLDDVNEVAAELCEHLSAIDPMKGVRPAAIVACAPLVDRDRNPFSITEDEVTRVIVEALSELVSPPEETIVPDTLITEGELREKVDRFPPQWVPLDGKASKFSRNDLGVVQRRLSNGIKVNLKSLSAEPQKANIRLYVPGGRLLEDKNKPGAVLLGARTMQEGGAFLSMTREEVELFCIDHLVMVEILATEGALIFDFQTMTSPGASSLVTGLEGSLQVAHIILTDFKFEEDAFERARQSTHEQFDSTIKSLETACLERILGSLTDNDERYLFPNHNNIENQSLESVKEAITSQLSPDSIEVSISGDVSMEELESLALSYLGTVPPRSQPRSFIRECLAVKPLGKSKQLGVYLPDMDERAMGYLAGPCPNIWGNFADGSSLSESIHRAAGKREDRRSNPFFSHVALLVLQEVANRRLFSVVREERRLTYDASFQLKGHEGVDGGWYLVSVTSSPSQVNEAVRACKEALNSLRGPFGVMGDAVQSAKRTLLNRYRNDLMTNKYWVDAMSGTQLDEVPIKSLRFISDYENVINGITVQDIQLLVEVLNFDESNMTTCIGIASPNPPGQ